MILAMIISNFIIMMNVMIMTVMTIMMFMMLLIMTLDDIYCAETHCWHRALTTCQGCVCSS